MEDRKKEKKGILKLKWRDKVEKYLKGKGWMKIQQVEGVENMVPNRNNLEKKLIVKQKVLPKNE